MLDRPAAPRSPALVVWDCDGTIADSWSGVRHAVDSALAAHGFRGCDEVILRSSIGLSLDRIFGRLLPERERRSDLVDSLVRTYREAFVTAGLPQTRLFPGMEAMLAGLQHLGMTSVLATSKSREAVELGLRHLDVEHCFARIISDDDVLRHQRKPDPEMVRLACRVGECEPSQAVVIGDTIFDIEMGQTAGATTIAVTWGNQPRCDLADASPDHIVDEVGELAALLGVPVWQTASR